MELRVEAQEPQQGLSGRPGNARPLQKEEPNHRDPCWEVDGPFSTTTSPEDSCPEDSNEVGKPYFWNMTKVEPIVEPLDEIKGWQASNGESPK